MLFQGKTHISERAGQNAEFTTHALLFIDRDQASLEIFLDSIDWAGLGAWRVITLKTHDREEILIINIDIMYA